MPGQYPYTWSEALDILPGQCKRILKKDSELEKLWEEDALGLDLRG